MSLAATFPILETENHHGEEILCIQQSSQRNEGFCPWESRWNNVSMMENNNATRDPEEAKELMSANVAISSQDLTLLSSTCLEDDCGACLSKDLDGTDDCGACLRKDLDGTENSVPNSNTQNNTSLCGSNQENKTSESKDLNPGDAMYMLKSLGKCCYSCSECISKSKNGLENNTEDSNHCEEIMGKFQNQKIQPTSDVIQPTSDVNAKCCMCSESNEKMEVGSQLSGDIGNLPQKLDFDFEKVQSQESVIQASDNTNEVYLEDKNPNHLNDEKETDISKGQDKKKSKMKQEVDWNSLREKWDSMRRKHCGCEPRSHNHMDSVDWEAVRSTKPINIADAIKERGQHNIIAGRIKV